MSQRRTVSRRLPRGGDINRFHFSPEAEALRSPSSKWLHCLTAFTVMLNMIIVGTINGWTMISLHYLLSGTGDVPLTLTFDESSWIVSLTVLGSMIGSLLGAQLVVRTGFKTCLVLCNTMFTVGWFIIYVTTSVQVLYLARVILGVGIGIANTVNPMYLSGNFDIGINGVVSSLVGMSASTGSMLAYSLGILMTYESLLLTLVIVSFIAVMSNTCFSVIGYSSVATDRMMQSRRLEYYKDIESPHSEEIELRALRGQTRNELPSRSRSNLPLQSRSNLSSQSKSDLLSQTTSQLLQSSTSEIQRTPTIEIHPEPTSEIHPRMRSELHQPSTSELRQPSTIEIHPEPTSEIHLRTRSELHQPSTSELRQPSTSEIHPDPTSEIHPRTRSELHQPSTSELRQPSTSDIHPDPTSEIHPRTRSELHLRSRTNLTTQSCVDSRGSTDIHDADMDESKYTCLTKLELILQRSNRKALFIMLGLIVAQHLSGNFITMQYMQVIFSKITMNIEPQEATIWVLCVNHISNAITTIKVESLERRVFLVMSTLGSCFTLIILANYLMLHEYKSDVSTVPTFPVIDLIIYQIMFQIGLGTLPNVLLYELFPRKLKGFVRDIIVIFDGIIGFIMPKLYQVVTDNVGLYANYHIFAISCFLAFLMVLIWIPETKGKTYQQIEALLVGKNLNSSNEEVRTNEMNS
ncbi:facilitated trehalose transporter Tret1-like isoform X1 [Bombus affinis]|uniref:facilitated trehalose transporter Tret1-like isoform X1 n=2 Tax=Bombus affinis TaxID=309941 RepID=UPI0021B71019|nr:facilitated trehalose transporter Tret1-like isoform X1 [Bombus affinis]